jgi:hypothetical protein
MLCTKCKRNMDIKAFYVVRGRYLSWCKECMGMSRHPWQNAYSAKAKGRVVDMDELGRLGKVCVECGISHLEAERMRGEVRGTRSRVRVIEAARGRAFKRVPSMGLVLVERGKGYVVGNMKMLCWYCRWGGKEGLEELWGALRESACD